MPDISPPVAVPDIITIMVHFTGQGVTIYENYPPGWHQDHKIIALGTAICKLMELYSEKLSTRNTP